MDRAVIERIDSFVYRHRVAEAMDAPIAVIHPTDTLQTAARAMQLSGMSALISVDGSGRPTGIMTEHDVLQAVAADGSAVLPRTVDALLSHPVVTVTPEDFLHVAIARMNSRRIRHRCVIERGSGRAVGIIVARCANGQTQRWSWARISPKRRTPPRWHAPIAACPWLHAACCPRVCHRRKLPR